MLYSYHDTTAGIIVIQVDILIPKNQTLQILSLASHTMYNYRVHSYSVVIQD